MKFLLPLLLLAGCVTQPEPRLFTLTAPVRIMVLSCADLARFSRQTLGREVAAFSLPEERIIYVPWADNGKQPDFYKLAHELAHLPEFLGHFHSRRESSPGLNMGLAANRLPWLRWQGGPAPGAEQLVAVRVPFQELTGTTRVPPNRELVPATAAVIQRGMGVRDGNSERGGGGHGFGVRSSSTNASSSPRLLERTIRVTPPPLFNPTSFGMGVSTARPNCITTR